MLNSRLNINIADINISIVSKRADAILKNRLRYAEFITGKKPDVVIENNYSLPSKEYLKDKKLIFSDRYWSLYHKNSDKIFLLKPSKLNSRIIGIFDFDMAKGNIYLNNIKNSWLRSRLGNIIILNLLSIRKRISFHACGVISGRKRGYLFLGNSGSGKTTMAKLWSKKGNIVVHDDKIIVYKKDSKFLMSTLYGDNKFNEYLSARAVSLKKIFFLRHGKENSVFKINSLEAFRSMINEHLLPLWDKKGVINAFYFCSDLAKRVPAYDLAFIPDYRCIDFIKKID